MADIRLRIFFNFGKRGAAEKALVTKRQTNAAASTIIQNVAFKSADVFRSLLVSDVEKQVGLDVQTEIANVASRYKRIIIGHERGPGGGGIESATIGGPRAAPPARSLTWAPRSPAYLRRKSKPRGQGGVGHTKWFQGWTHYMGSTLGKGATWTDIFGPIRVSVMFGASRGLDPFQVPRGLGGQRYRPAVKEGQIPKEIRTRIGSIEVSALERVTPAMLGGYSKSGVPGAVAAAGYEELAYRLGGPTVYRPTMEPFLEFVLTKSIPYAVRRRVEVGLGKRIAGAWKADNAGGTAVRQR